MIALGDTSAAGWPLRIELCPNCSLSVRGALLFFGSLCFVSFAIAGMLALEGFWPVLPFAGLEMALLGWALKASLGRRFHRQTITVTDSDVSVELRERTYCSQVVFPRHWAQVKNSAAPHRACIRAGSRSSRTAATASWAASSRKRRGVDLRCGCNV